jgi:hypothetical protein
MSASRRKSEPSADRIARDRIADSHGCEIMSCAGGRTAICVKPAWSQGSPLDDERTSACRDDLIAAGISAAKNWLS